MPQNTQVRIEYDSYVPAGNGDHPELSPFEKTEATASHRANHLTALWFLLANIDLNHTPESREEIGMQLRDYGQLGLAISQGLFRDVDELAEFAKIDPSGLDNRGTGEGGDSRPHDSVGGPQ